MTDIDAELEGEADPEAEAEAEVDEVEQAILSPEAAAARARTYSARGVEALKVYNRLRADTYQRLATEAQQLRRPLVGHLPKAVPLDDAVQAGQRSFEHAHLFVRHCFDNAAAWRGGALDGEDPTGLAERMVANLYGNDSKSFLE